MFSSNTAGEGAAPPGQQAYTTPGTYSWIAPPGVTSVCVVCVGTGGLGAYWYYNGSSGNACSSGGGLGWKNNIPVVPGTSYAVYVGVSGYSYFIDTSTVCGNAGSWAGAGGTYTGDGGGNGGWYASGANVGGAGAGGYTGTGGSGGSTVNAGAGGGGAGGGYRTGGGGVGILGQGTSGTSAGQGGSGGGSGSVYYGGSYGGGSATGPDNGTTTINYGGYSGGAVRIIWGVGRSFPSTNTGNV